MGKKKNKLYIHKASKAEDSKREPAYKPQPTKRKLRPVDTQSLAERWNKFTTAEKVLIIVMGLVAAGLAVGLAYRLIPIIFENVCHNPTEPPKFLTPTDFKATFADNHTYPVCPVRHTTVADKNTASVFPITSTSSFAPTKPIQEQSKDQHTFSPVIAHSSPTTLPTKLSYKPFKIDIKPALRAEILAKPEGHEWIQLLEKEILQMRKMLPYTIHPKLLSQISNDPTFSIELVAYNDPELTRGSQFLGTMAHYLPISNKLLIGSDTHMSDQEKLILLRNEMHHVAVRYTNFGKQSAPEQKLPTPNQAIKIIRPAMQDQWKTDGVLVKKHQEALDAGFKRVQQFKELLKQAPAFKYGTHTDQESKGKLKQGLEVLKHYEPIVYAEEMSISDYRQFEKSFTKHEHGKIMLPHPTAPGYLLSVKRSPSGVILRYNFLKSENVKDRAEAFIQDVERYRTTTGKHGSYMHLSIQEDSALELSSFIQEIAPNILQYFFPEWCRYFSDYHTVENYCEATSASSAELH